MQQGRGDRLVTVFGGSGFVGRYVVRALARAGWRVRVACRRPDLAGHVLPMGSVGQVQPVQANLRYPNSVRRAVEGADAIVNCVGILAPSGAQTFSRVHVAGVQAIADAAVEAGIDQVVHVSAIGADEGSSSTYAKTKGAGEAALLAAVPGAVILRPSIIFGPEDEFFNRFAAMAQVSPVLPLIGGGGTKFQPVFVGDVAAAAAQAVEGRAQAGTIYELGGPEVASFRELMDRTLAYAQRRRGYIPLPFIVAKFMALLTWPLPNSVRPFTYDQVRLLQQDTVVSDEAIGEQRTLAGLGIDQPATIDAVVPAYLERFSPKGQYSHYRG